MKVYFIGAGPGDPELLTIKGKTLIEKCKIIIYAGSLVNERILEYAPKDASIYNSAKMTLEEVVAVYKDAQKQNMDVARIHTGDPSIYGAIKEQMDALAELEIEYQMVPGVSSFLAAAAAVEAEFTLPSVSQTVIVTRLEGRTPVPEKEKLTALAKHQASMCIFLSVHMIEDVVTQLSTQYPEATPIAVVEKASWPEERVVTGTLETIAAAVKKAGITKTAMIMVGDFLDSEYERSKLYDPQFSHCYREKE
ncbi:precorrin-4/cobalt-precorrin-4 C11-methyltransferase [Desulfitispora alkaliphila]|uniref:precorrin-4 C(11)-methyltransferase n=1 Tax=Desulfitispora alkaliphila TaxID=622674 RepID=UPI003D1ED64D